jgi:hypothetical protein
LNIEDLERNANGKEKEREPQLKQDVIMAD